MEVYLEDLQDGDGISKPTTKGALSEEVARVCGSYLPRTAVE